MPDKVLVFLISFNRQPFLKMTLEALFNNTEHPFDLVIVDNNSANPTKKLLKEFENKNWPNGTISTVIYKDKNYGSADVLSEIKNYLKPSQHCLTITNDVLVPTNKSWLGNLVTILDAYGVEIVGLVKKGTEADVKQHVELMGLPNEQYLTPFGKLIIVPISVAPIHLFSNKFMLTMDFKNLNRNNFFHLEQSECVEGQIRDHCKLLNYKISYLYSENNPIFLDEDSYNQWPELTSYKNWKIQLYKNYREGKAVPLPFEVSEYSEDNSPLNIKF